MAIRFSKTHHHHKSEKNLSNLSSKMAGTSPSAQCQGNPGRNVVIATLLVLSWQAALAAPVVQSAPLSPHENSLTARKLLEWTMEHSFPTNTTATLSSEVKNVTIYPTL